MAVLDIVLYPYPQLQKPAEPVAQVDDDTGRIVQDLYDTMYHYEHCVGLAAPQIAIGKRIAVIDVSATRNNPLCLINPQITNSEGEVTEYESCMSVPSGFKENVKRAKQVTVDYWDEHGEKQQLTAQDFLARAVQHEVDHLDGKLFFNRLSRLKSERLQKRIHKFHRQHQAD